MNQDVAAAALFLKWDVTADNVKGSPSLACESLVQYGPSQGSEADPGKMRKHSVNQVALG